MINLIFPALLFAGLAACAGGPPAAELAASPELTAEPAPAGPASRCAPRPVVVRTLAEKYAESQVAMGFVSTGILEVWATVDGEGFTVLISTPGGLACLITSGQWWRHKVAGGPEADPGGNT